MDFEQLVVENTKPVLVYFGAEWCPPCKVLKPKIKEFRDSQTDVDVVFIDVDEQSSIANEYKIMKVPTLLLFNGGEHQEVPRFRLVEDYKKHIQTAVAG